MSATLTETRIANGIWEGLLLAATPPPLVARHEGVDLPGLEVAPLPGVAGRFHVRLPIPVAALSDGVHTVLILSGDTILARFCILAGTPLEADLRAEIDLLRAELDLLKRAFRRHVRKTPA